MSFSHIELFSTIDLFKTNENCFISSIINDSAFFEIWKKSHNALQIIIVTERLLRSVLSVINDSAFSEIWEEPHNILWIVPFYLHDGITINVVLFVFFRFDFNVKLTNVLFFKFHDFNIVFANENETLNSKKRTLHLNRLTRDAI